MIAAAGCAHPVSPPAPVAGCAPQEFAIAGVCMAPDEAARYCGKGAHPEGGGCRPVACTEGEPIDLSSGECLPLLSLRRLVTEQGGSLTGDSGVGCKLPEAGLVVEGSSLACLARPSFCGRGARWKDNACHPDPTCPLGAIADLEGACVPVVRRSGPDTIVDVGAWIRVVIGPDGGDGTPTVCGPLVARPWRAGVISHGNAIVDVQLDFVFPDNNVKDAKISIAGHKQADPHNVEASTSVPIARYMEPVTEALRSLGGTSNAASASVRVRCPLEGGSDIAGAARPTKDDAPHTHRGKHPS